MKARRVVVTGLGLVTPLGIGGEEFWTALLEGRSTVTRADLLEGKGEPCQLVARLPQLDIRSLVPDRKLLRVMCDSDRYALAAAQLAVSGAGEIGPAPERRGAFVGTRKELMAYEMLREASIAAMDAQGHISSTRLGELGFPLIPPLTLVTGMPNGCLFALSVLHTIKGGGANLIGSGEAGLGAIGGAYRAILEGRVEWALAAGQDAAANRWDYADLYALGLLSRWAGDPAQAMKPFDLHRDGFVLGEGAGAVVLEELEGAQRRGAPILAELSGYAESCDAHGLLQTEAEGRALSRAVEGALQQAGLAPQEVGYVNACGTATLAGDRSEAQALRQVFAGQARRPLVSALKPALGHLLAASGAVEFGATVLALHHRIIPPTLNRCGPDPELEFEAPGAATHQADLRAALTISRGIGGQNAVAALRRWEPS